MLIHLETVLIYFKLKPKNHYIFNTQRHAMFQIIIIIIIVILHAIIHAKINLILQTQFKTHLIIPFKGYIHQ